MTLIRENRLNMVDENQTRIHAALVVLLMGVYLLGGGVFVIYALLYDFLVRIYVAPQLSPLYIISAELVRFVSLEKKSASKDKKEFASHIGLTILFIVLFAELLDEREAAFVTVGFFAAWKLFEASYNICIACEFYEYLKHKNIKVVSL